MVREYTKIQFRRDSSGNWISANPTLLAGEIGYETDTQKFKIGTGSLAWNALSYANRPFVGNGLNYGSDGVVFADIDQAEFDALEERVETIETVSLPDAIAYTDQEVGNLKTYVDNADSTLDAKLDSEISNRQNDVTDLTNALSTETSNRIAADSDITDRLDIIEDDTQTVSGSISYQVKQEEDRATAIEDVLREDVDRIDGLSSESGSFRYEVDQEKQRAEQAESSLDARLDTLEGSGAGSIEADIAAEAALRAAEDTAIRADLAQEVSDRAAADTTIQNQVDIIKDTTGNVTGSISKAVADEAALRVAGDTALQANITAEEAARISADSALSGRLDSLEIDPTTEAYVDSAVEAEKDRAELVETALQTAIDDIENPNTGKADLIGGKVDPTQLPDLAISQYLGDKTTAQRLDTVATVGQEGDWCFDTDHGVSYIVVDGSNTGVEAGWKSIVGSDSNVVSVQGRSGAVTLTKDEFNVDHLENLSGMPPESDDLGVFSGSTISSNSSIKNALQQLETTLELKEDSADLATVANTGSYNDLTDTPSAVSDFTNDLSFIDAAGAPVQSVAGKQGAVTLVKADIGLDNVDNTSDLDKPLSTATTAALGDKLDSSAASAFGLSLIDDADAAAARATLDVDQSGTDNSTDVTIDPSGNTYITDLGSQVLRVDNVPLDSAVSGILPIGNGGTGASNAAGARTALGVDAAGTDNSTDVTLTGKDYLSLSGQQITALEVDLNDDVSGILPVTNGGTGVATVGELQTLIDLDNVITLTGVTGGDEDLGGFNGSTISDDVTIKVALQELETAVEAIDVSTKADLASPTFTGVPSAPTAGAGTDTTQIATTAFVTAAVAALNAAALRTLLGIVSAANDGASGLASGEMYFNTTSNTYVLVA